MHPAKKLPSSEFAARTSRLNGILRRHRLDALIIHSAVNRYYFTGFTSSNGIILAERGEEPLFFTDSRYLTAARKEVCSMPAKLLWRAAEQSQVIAALGCSWKRVGYEGSLSAARFLQLQATLPDVEWIDISGDVARLRAVKSIAEQHTMRTACAANDQLFATVVEKLHADMSEWEISTLIRHQCSVFGQEPSFDPVVCVGRNAAECHHHPGLTRLRNNRALLLDIGVKLDHYCSDMTRTLFYGTAGNDFKMIHQIVLDANRKAVERIKPGVSCEQIDKTARDYIKHAGYGKYFNHGLGHGLGLEVHEQPGFTPGDKTVLVPGMILTVEPGIYLPNRCGVRIEEVVLITSDGCELLSSAPICQLNNILCTG